jgi:hypothetical protein
VAKYVNITAMEMAKKLTREKIEKNAAPVKKQKVRPSPLL